MSILTKTKNYEVKLGTPATDAVSGTSATGGTPARCYQTIVSKTICAPNQLCLQSIGELGIDPNTGGLGQGGVEITGHSSYYTSKCSPAMVCAPKDISEFVCEDAVPGTPGTLGRPGTPATQTQIIEHFNEGWNSWSKSVDSFESGSYLSYTVPKGVRGVMVAIGVDGKSGDNISSFAHAILVDPSGVVVFEDGVNVETVSPLHTSLSQVRMYRQPDSSVICVLVNGTDTRVFLFSNESGSVNSAPMSAYCYMYMGDDSVSSAEFVTGEVQFGAA